VRKWGWQVQLTALIKLTLFRRGATLLTVKTEGDPEYAKTRTQRRLPTG